MNTDEQRLAINTILEAAEASRFISSLVVLPSNAIMEEFKVLFANMANERGIAPIFASASPKITAGSTVTRLRVAHPNTDRMVGGLRFNAVWGLSNLAEFGEDGIEASLRLQALVGRHDVP